MRAPKTPRNALTAALLSLALSACGTSTEGAPAGGAGTGGTGGPAAGSGGSFAGSVSGGSAGSAAASGTAGTGGSGALGTGGAAGAAGGMQTGGAAGAASAGAGMGGAPEGGAGNGASGQGGQPGAGSGGGGAAGVSGADPGGGNGGSGQQGGAGSGGQPGVPSRSISFGTLLDADAVMSSARALAQSLTNPGAPGFRAKGDQRRSYRFPATGANEPYRLIVPASWDGTSSLPLAMFLHGAGANESTYLDQNGAQMVELAEQHGYLLVSPMGDEGAYGNFLRLSAPFGDEAGAAELMAQVTDQSERTNQLSEQDVINVLELVLSEYPVDRDAVFLFGHSMGSGGTWYIGGKYAGYFRGLAPMSGPFVQERVYPWESVRPLSLFVTEGTQTPSLDASRLLRDWLEENAFDSDYLEVNADHGGMVPLVLPNVFQFFDAARAP